MPEPSVPTFLRNLDAARPLLASDVVITAERDRCRLETQQIEFEVLGHYAVQLLNLLLSKATGASTLAKIASELGVSREDAFKMLQPLSEEGIVLDVGAALDAATPESYLREFFCEAGFFARPIFAGSFWRNLVSGQASRSLIFGWGIEFAHFVEAANEYMAAGVAHCREDAEVREWLARHYIEEADHVEFFYKGLEECGLDRAQLVVSPPLPSTRGLVNHLTELAIEGAIPYAAAFGVMQSSRQPADQSTIDNFYDSLSAMYDFATPLFEGFRRHAQVDVHLRHNKTVFEMIVESGRISQSGRERALESARSVAEHFMLFFEGILDYYSAPGVVVPRHAVKLAALS